MGDATFHVDPDTYLERIRAALPGYEVLQHQAVGAIPFEPRDVLELGIGSGETTKRLLGRFPNAQITGVDVSPTPPLLFVSKQQRAGVLAGRDGFKAHRPDRSLKVAWTVGLRFSMG